MARDHPGSGGGASTILPNCFRVYEPPRGSRAAVSPSALAIWEKSFGQEHPDVAIGLNNLALSLQATNRLAEAEPLFRCALAIWERVSRARASWTWRWASSTSRLLPPRTASPRPEPPLSSSDGKISGRKSLARPDHPNVASALNNLAGVLEAMNRLDEAEPLFRRALAILEKSYGPDHPQVAFCLNNLAELLRATGRPSEAEPLFRRALAIRENSLGPDHPEVAISLHNLAFMLKNTNRSSMRPSRFDRRALCDRREEPPRAGSIRARLPSATTSPRSRPRWGMGREGHRHGVMPGR